MICLLDKRRRTQKLARAPPLPTCLRDHSAASSSLKQLFRSSFEMGKNKQDTKSSDKSSGGKSGKGKGKGDSGETETSKSKGAQSINVRHILVRRSYRCATGTISMTTSTY